MGDNLVRNIELKPASQLSGSCVPKIATRCCALLARVSCRHCRPRDLTDDLLRSSLHKRHFRSAARGDHRGLYGCFPHAVRRGRLHVEDVTAEHTGTLGTQVAAGTWYVRRYRFFLFLLLILFSWFFARLRVRTGDERLRVAGSCGGCSRRAVRRLFSFVETTHPTRSFIDGRTDLSKLDNLGHGTGESRS